jgi:Cys-tRNA(Pro) deacylase
LHRAHYSNASRSWCSPMPKERLPTTNAVRFLKEKGIPFVLRLYDYQEKGGTKVAARELRVDEHEVVKTLVMEDDRSEPLLILMHGDKEVSTKALARTLGTKAVIPCTPETATRHTGYRVGGTSPFGTRKVLRVFVEASILDLPRIYINAGKRGLLAEMLPADLIKALNPTPVNVAI